MAFFGDLFEYLNPATASFYVRQKAEYMVSTFACAYTGALLDFKVQDFGGNITSKAQFDELSTRDVFSSTWRVVGITTEPRYLRGLRSPEPVRPWNPQYAIATSADGVHEPTKVLSMVSLSDPSRKLRLCLDPSRIMYAESHGRPAIVDGELYRPDLWFAPLPIDTRHSVRRWLGNTDYFIDQKFVHLLVYGLALRTGFQFSVIVCSGRGVDKVTFNRRWVSEDRELVKGSIRTSISATYYSDAHQPHFMRLKTENGILIDLKFGQFRTLGPGGKLSFRDATILLDAPQQEPERVFKVIQYVDHPMIEEQYRRLQEIARESGPGACGDLFMHADAMMIEAANIQDAKEELDEM